MGSRKKIASGVFWSILVNIINGLYGFISVPILLAYFGKENYGLIGLAMSVNVYLRLMDLGLNSTNVRFFANWLEKGQLQSVKKLFQTSLSFYGIIGLINALILLVVAFYSAELFKLATEQDTIIKNLFYILAISALVSWISACFEQLIKAHELVGWTQQLHLLPKLAQIIILILTVTCSFSINLYYALTTFSVFLIIPFCIKKIYRLCPFISFCPGFDKSILKTILPYTLNIFSFGLFQFSVNYLRPVFLGLQGDIGAVADYRILNGIIALVMTVGGAFLSVILPSASRAVARGDEDAQAKVAYDGTKYISISICLCSFGLISISKDLLSVYVGEQYIYLTIWLILWTLTTLTTHNQAISSLILAGTNIRAITYCTIVSSIIGLSVCWMTIPIFQIGGTVIGYIVYGLIQILFYYIYYWPKVMHLDSKRIFLGSFFKYVVIGAALSFSLLYIHIADNHWVSLLIKGSIFTLFYMAITYFTLTQTDREFFMHLLKRKNQQKIKTV